MTKLIIILLALISISCAEQTTLTHSDSFYQGTKQISLIDNKGNKTLIGTIDFINQDSAIRYKIHLKHDLFTDYFLSMKEMKCLEGPELWCHLAYPYNNPQTITESVFSWLSHDFLFMYKKKSAFGAKFYNGIYYDFKQSGDRLIGTAMAVDLNFLAAPPEDQTVPPISSAELDEIDGKNRWLPLIEIK